MELEDQLHQCGGESERPIVCGSKSHDGAKHLELDNNSVAGSEAADGFMTTMVSKAEVRAQFPIDLQSAGLNVTNDNNRFNFRILTVKTEETPWCSLIFTASMRSTKRIIPSECTATYSQTTSLPVGAVNSVNTDHQSAGNWHSMVDPVSIYIEGVCRRPPGKAGME